MRLFSLLIVLSAVLIGCPSGDTPTPESPAAEASAGEGSAEDEAAAEPAADPADEPAVEPTSQPGAASAPGAANTAEGSGRDALIRAANPSRVQLHQPQLRLETRGMNRELRLAPSTGTGTGNAAGTTLHLPPASE